MLFSKKKMLAFVFLMIMLISVSAFALTVPSDARAVYLSKNQNKVYSGTVYGHYKLFSGEVYKSSDEYMSFAAQYMSNNAWHTDYTTDIFVNPGGLFINRQTQYRTYETLWRLMVEPAYTTSGASGMGYIRCIGNCN